MDIHLRNDFTFLRLNLSGLTASKPAERAYARALIAVN